VEKNSNQPDQTRATLKEENGAVEDKGKRARRWKKIRLGHGG